MISRGQHQSISAPPALLPVPTVVAAATESSRSKSWPWLVCGILLLLFADGRNTIALAAWLAPACLLRFVRDQRIRIALPIAYVVLVGTRAIAFRGMIPIPGATYYVFMFTAGVLAVFPYLLDRVIAAHLSGFASTLIFPAALVAEQFLFSHGPQGSWGSNAYTQADNLPLLQMLSVTGLWGITFLIGWFAAVFNWIWEGFPSRAVLRGGAVFAGVFLSVLLLGGVRLAVFAPSSPTVRVASLSRSNDRPQIRDAVVNDVHQQQATNAETKEFIEWENAISNELLARTEHEARAGAKVIFWAEGNAPVLKPDEPELIARGRQLAATYQIYLGMALATWSTGEQRPLQNKLVMIAPTGQVAWQYLKARPTPGPETAIAAATDGRLRSVDTPYGTLSAVICYDADFPKLLAQASALGAGLVIVPASDWRAIDPRHTQMASFRAIEQGFNLVRQASGGLSAAYDYQGRRLAAMDEYQAKEYTLISEVPAKGVSTIYSRLGDWFAWLCLAAVTMSLVVGWRNRAIAVRW